MFRREAVRKFLLFILKFGIASAIIGWLIWNNRKNLADAFSAFNYWYLLPALAVYLLHMVISAWRWFKLAQYLHFNLNFSQALSLTMQGYFFSLVIPGGAIGGDVARIGFLTRRSPEGTRFDGAVTVLIDRIVGMLALFGLTIVLMIWDLPILLNIKIPGLEQVTWLVPVAIIGLFGLCVSGILAMVAIFFHRQLEKIHWIAALMQLGNRWSHGCIDELTRALDIYRSRWKELGWLTLISVFGIHLMTVAAVWVVSMGLPGASGNLLSLTVAVTVGNIAGLIPLSLSGIGIRDVTIEAGLLAAGGFATTAAAIPLLYTTTILLGNLAGGIFFILDPGKKMTAAEMEK